MGVVLAHILRGNLKGKLTMKTGLITGVSSGIGWVMTTKPLERGDRVVAWALTLTADKV